MPLYPAPVTAAQALVQARRTAAFTLGAAFADIDLDTTDIENFDPTVEHTAADQITVKVAGQYGISYVFTTPGSAQTVQSRVRVNDAGVLAGSERSVTTAGTDAENVSCYFVASLAANDFVTLQALSSAGAPDIAAGLILCVIHLAGQKGDQGAASATDVDAVHVNVGNEIALIAEKVAPAGADLLIIEDSGAGGVKKRLQIGNLPGGVALTANAPANVTKAAAAVGLGIDAARDDHKHDVSTDIPPVGAVAVGNTANEGAATSLARSDHRHTVTAAAPVSVGAANAAGAATTFVRSDHVHSGLTRDANDFAAFAGKASPVAADLLLIEDSAAAGVKKQISLGSLPGPANVLHTNVAAEISAMTEKTIPINADLIVIEDSAAANAKKKVQLGNLPLKFGQNYQSAVSEANSTTTSAAFGAKTTLTTPALTGVYRVNYYCELSAGAVNRDFSVRMYNSTDAVELCADTRQLRLANTFTSVNGFADITFTGLAKTIVIQFASPDGSTTITIRRARLEIWRET